MSAPAVVRIDPSQFPTAVRAALTESFRSRRVNHKFHYDSVRQTQAWLDLHAAYSPSRTDPNCAEVYEQGFAAAATLCAGAPSVQLVGLGCGGGKKDSTLLRALRSAAVDRLGYIPADVSTAMVLVAREAALEVVSPECCLPFVCDFATAQGLGKTLADLCPPGAKRLFTFFGMIPNFEPHEILPVLADCLAPGDDLLFSANLAPGPDYDAGVAKILPLYDNQLTRQWLSLILRDVGIESQDGQVAFSVEPSEAIPSLKRIQATFTFNRPRQIQIDSDAFAFHPGDAIRLFFSYRHTPSGIERLLAAVGLRVLDQWITHSEEEGVFLCRRQ